MWPMSCSSVVTKRALVVGLADDHALLNAAAGHGQRPRFRPVVAAQVAVDPRRPAELRHGDDQHVVEHPSLGQVLDHGGERLIELRHQVDRAVEIVAVRVPAVGRRP